ncbi:MAG: ABC transporter substrate-binding protein, partial [Moorea sp. SIO3I7]|nr:ABC transporter substrate-binding protein [Moorena sp. SIO3I7]
MLATPSDPATFNTIVNTSPFGVFGYIYEGLLSENGMTGELEPALAESWDISSDRQQITFTLRDGLKWSDGEPLTVDDVIFTYQQLYLNPKIPTVSRDFLKIGSTGKYPSVRKLDQQRVEFTLPQPFAPFVRSAGTLAILPAHALRESVQATDGNGNPQFLSTWGTNTNPQDIVSN